MKRLSLAALVTLAACLCACSPADENSFQGYVEADYVYMASPMAGRLESLLVLKGAAVDAGAPLFELESEFELQALRGAEQDLISAEALLADMETGKRPEEVAMAEAQLEQARADAANAHLQHERNKTLYRNKGVSQREYENTEAALLVAEARVAELARQVEVYNLPEREKKLDAQQALVESAKARVAQAQWELNQKRVEAPAQALVVDTIYREGEWVAAGSPVVQLLPPGNVKLRFFVPEAKVGAVRVGAPVLFSVDGLGEGLAATVNWVAPEAEYTPPVIYSNETRAKLVFMVEARPGQDTASLLHPGQPISVRLP